MKNKIIFVFVAAIVLLAAFFCLGEKNNVVTVENMTTAGEVSTEITTEYIEDTTAVTELATVTTEGETQPTSIEQTSAAEMTAQVTTVAVNVVVEAQTEHTTASNKVTLEVSYKNLIGKYDTADANGGIVYSGAYQLNGGETAFDVLKNSMREAGIPLEFSTTPLYNSVYVEGIDNVYEFDFGDLSGWMYSVNGSFPGYSSSEYKVSAGDEIKFVYTLDLGKDVGNEYSG
jgi:hypothetical protein